MDGRTYLSSNLLRHCPGDDLKWVTWLWPRPCGGSLSSKG